MALDMADHLAGGDIVFENSDKYRAYNLLKRSQFFIDNPRIGLDISAMIQAGISDLTIESVITQYLIEFGCNMHLIFVKSENGHICLEFQNQ